MSLTTRIIVTTPVRPAELFAAAREATGTASVPELHSRHGLVTGTAATYQPNPFYENERGHSELGWLVVRYGADGLLQADVDQVCDESLADDDHTYVPSGFASVELDSAGADEDTLAETSAAFEQLCRWLNNCGAVCMLRSDYAPDRGWLSRDDVGSRVLADIAA